MDVFWNNAINAVVLYVFAIQFAGGKFYLAMNTKCTRISHSVSLEEFVGFFRQGLQVLSGQGQKTLWTQRRNQLQIVSTFSIS